MNFFARLEKSKDFWFLFATSFIFFLLRFPSLFEPYWYGDEGIYQTIAAAINHGSLLYRDIWDNKPPLLYFLYAIFGGDQFSLRLLSLLFGVLSIIVFFFLAKSVLLLNEKRRHVPKLPLYSATALFALLFGLPLLEGNIANAENFMLLPILIAALLLLRYLQKPSAKGLLYAGILLALAFLFKIVAVFDIGAFVFFLLIVHVIRGNSIRKDGRALLPFLYGFLIPVSLTLLYFTTQGGLDSFLSSVFGQNITYVGYRNAFIIPQGLLYLKFFLLFIVVGILFFLRKKIPTGSLFVYLWLAFSVGNAFFSGRPYTHYTLVLLPSFCLFTTLLFLAFEKKSLQFLHIAIAILLIFSVFHSFDIYKKNRAYYQNFLLYLFNKKSLTSYQQFFDPHTPRDYAVAQFLKTHSKKNDVVFLWGNSAQVYKMSETLPPGRYTVAFHIGNAKERMETAKALAVKKPKFIVVYSSQNFPFNLSSYRYIYSIPGAILYESVF